MHKIILLLTLSAFLFSQQAEVTNIQAAQRTDGSQIVDITYDLTEDEIFEEFLITVEVSFDGGASFTALSNSTGDLGEGITAGFGKSINWNFGQQFSDTYSDQVQYKITAESDAIVVVENEGCGTVPEGDIPFEMVHVPPGDFTFGEGNEVTPLDCNYEIMKYEVTDYEYVVFMLSALEDGLITVSSDGAWGPYVGDEATSPQESIQYIDFNYSKISWNGEIFEVQEGYVNHPVVGVTYFGAYMFADYYGMELPNQYEWEKAARGITDNYYPWGNDISIERANYQEFRPFAYGFGSSTTPVGMFNGSEYECGNFEGYVDGILITEISDPQNSSDAGRYIELYNGNSLNADLNGWAIQRWTNANTEPSEPTILTGTISANGFYIICNDADKFSATYGLTCDQDIGTGGAADSNGDENIALLWNGNVIDMFGVPGEDGSGTGHEFEDGRAERVLGVSGPSPIWVQSEWNIDNDSGGGNGPQYAPEGFDPGYWIGSGEGSAECVNLITINSPSSFGAYDMGGNVSEWVYDVTITSNQRQHKGGSYHDSDDALAIYALWSASSSNSSIGFRCIRRLSAE
tara:strand:- start:2565 stop:4289 length:1725 start_codon:yes stop_codon:yes gene_type:complete